MLRCIFFLATICVVFPSSNTIAQTADEFIAERCAGVKAESFKSDGGTEVAGSGKTDCSTLGRSCREHPKAAFCKAQLPSELSLNRHIVLVNTNSQREFTIANMSILASGDGSSGKVDGCIGTFGRLDRCIISFSDDFEVERIEILDQQGGPYELPIDFEDCKDDLTVDHLNRFRLYENLGQEAQKVIFFLLPRGEGKSPRRACAKRE